MMGKKILYFLLSTALVLCECCTKEGTAVSGDDEISIIPVLQETKATLIEAGDLSGERVHVDAYNSSSGVKHIDGNLLYDGKWMFYTSIKDVHYYWPQNSNLDVLAYSPANKEKTCMSIISKNTIKCTGLPMNDADQVDTDEFICGYKENCKQTDADGAIEIDMKRPFAIVDFYLDEAVRSTLKTVEITGIYNSGTYTVDTEAWSSLEGSGTFLCTVNKKYPEDLNNRSHIGGPFLVVPQNLPEAVKLKLTYRSKGNEKDTVTETTLGQAALEEVPHTKIGAWECGKRYVYYISLNGAANETRLAVTVNEWKKEGNSEIDVK